MAKKKSRSSRKRSSAASRKNPSLKFALIRVGIGLAILLALVVATGLLVDHFLRRGDEVPKTRTAAVQPTAPPRDDHSTPLPHKSRRFKKPKGSSPRYEIFPPDAELTPPPATRPQPPPVGDGKPRVALIIDDLGYDGAIAEKFIDLGSEITLSVFPHSPFQKTILSQARKNGMEVMLHLPMEPMEYPSVDPGPDALLTTMSPDELIGMLNRNLDSAEGIKGVNNHMGSRLTADSERMNQVFSILKRRGLYFIDSRTTADTICYQSARLLRVPFAQRDVFLDHDQHPDVIRRQVERLISVARTRGCAVGIGHPHPETYTVLRDMMPGLKRHVRLVPASAVVMPTG